MVYSSVKRLFTPNFLGVGNWTPNLGATQNRRGLRLFRSDVCLPIYGGVMQSRCLSASFHDSIDSHTVKRACNEMHARYVQRCLSSN